MRALRPDPGLFDLAAWQERLAELRTEPADDSLDAEIAMVEAHIAAILAPPKKTPAEAR